MSKDETAPSLKHLLGPRGDLSTALAEALHCARARDAGSYEVVTAISGAFHAVLEIRAALSRLPSTPCSVCAGQPLASGRECICGGRGTEYAEAQGLRERLVDLEIALGFYPNIPPRTSKAYDEVRAALPSAPREPTDEAIVAAIEVFKQQELRGAVSGYVDMAAIVRAAYRVDRGAVEA